MELNSGDWEMILQVLQEYLVDLDCDNALAVNRVAQHVSDHCFICARP